VKVLIVTGIWPPDVGGPASHAPEFAGWLRSRGIAAEVVTTADQEPARQPYPVHWVARSLPPGVRHAQVVRVVTEQARHADVIYEISMLGRSTLGSTLSRTPFVAKLPSDPAYERARRRGLFAGDMDAFQHERGGVGIRALRLARGAELRRAAHVVCPSAYLRELAIGWGVAPQRVTVVPNPAPPVPADMAARDELRTRHGMDGPTLVFAGRLTRQKTLEVAFAAVERSPGVSLLVVGDGPERAQLEAQAGTRVRFLGAQPRERVLELFRAADASLLSSAWENFPHGVVESLAVGTPVISTDIGGVAEVVRDGENGLLVPAGDVEALAAAIRRYLGDPALQERLRAAAPASLGAFTADTVYGSLEAILRGAMR
jgi:glycosyltransferase involved in cell wall biosynthesis